MISISEFHRQKDELYRRTWHTRYIDRQTDRQDIGIILIDRDVIKRDRETDRVYIEMV